MIKCTKSTNKFFCVLTNLTEDGIFGKNFLKELRYSDVLIVFSTLFSVRTCISPNYFFIGNFLVRNSDT